MAWRQVDPRHLGRGADETRVRWYVESGTAADGALLIWLDSAGNPVEFQLTWCGLPAGREYIIQWRATGTLRAGVVDPGERTGRHKMSPLIRFSDRLPPNVASPLRANVKERLHVLDPACREAIRAALDQLAPPDGTPAS